MTCFIAGEGRRMYGQTVPSELPAKWAMSMRQPLGVCSIITPWNFPMAIPSWKIGRLVNQNAAPYFKKVHLEMGGKNCIMVMDDANLELLLEGALWGGFGTTGQRCTAASRLIVHERVHDAFVKEFVARVKALRVGQPGEAIAIGNDVPYGLSASIYTQDINRAFVAMRELYTGVFYVNAPTIGAEVHLPFGGTKATGNGHREAGTAALDVFSEWKSVYVDFRGKLQRAQIDNAQSCRSDRWAGGNPPARPVRPARPV